MRFLAMLFLATHLGDVFMFNSSWGFDSPYQIFVCFYILVYGALFLQ